MSAEAITIATTIVSGLGLLAVFALVGWNLRRNHTPDERTDAERPRHDPR